MSFITCYLFLFSIFLHHSFNHYFYSLISNEKEYNDYLKKYIDEIKYHPPFRKEELNIPNIINYKTVREIRLIRNYYVIIASLSSPHHFRKRYSFRKLFLKYNRVKNCRIIFFIGLSKYEKKNILDIESYMYDDLVQFSFQNSYANLTLLSIMALRYCYENFKYIKFYIKTDDDMIINYPLLNRLIKNTNSTSNLVYGHIGGGVKANRDNKNRNYIPYSQYKYEYIPRYVYGGLIIISSHTLVDIYNQTLQNQSYIWREDINLGVICTMCKCNIMQFPKSIDISININNCSLSGNIIASEYKTKYDMFYCIK